MEYTLPLFPREDNQLLAPGLYTLGELTLIVPRDRKEGQGFILEPTMNRQIQANLINKGLININVIFIMGIYQREVN